MGFEASQVDLVGYHPRGGIDQVIEGARHGRDDVRLALPGSGGWDEGRDTVARLDERRR